MGLDAAATTTGLLIGIVCGLLPVGMHFFYRFRNKGADRGESQVPRLERRLRQRTTGYSVLNWLLHPQTLLAAIWFYTIRKPLDSVLITIGMYMPAVWGFLACVAGGFSTGIWGGGLMMLLSMAVVMSYAYVDRQDPFTSRASIDEVDFEESTRDFFIRRMAALGRTTRASIQALVRNKAGFLGFLGLTGFFVMTVFGPMFIEYDGEAHYRDRLLPGARTLYQPPSNEFPLGLDWQGRDILSHIVYGGKQLIQTSTEAGILTTIFAVILGSAAGLSELIESRIPSRIAGALIVGALLTLGVWFVLDLAKAPEETKSVAMTGAAIAGSIAGLFITFLSVDDILSTISNFILTIPQFPLLLVLASIQNFDNNHYLALLFALLGWPVLMRAVRAQVLSLRERDYVQAAIALDLGLFHIILREVFPNMISYIVVNMIFSIRSAMYYLVGLVFLGMVPLQEPDWGIMIYFGRTKGAIFNPNAVSMLLSPIVAIALFQLSLVLFTRSLEEIFNPRLRAEG